MSKKPMKIKRYSKSMGAGRSAAIKTAVISVVAVVALLGVGYLVAPFIINTASSMWYDFKNGAQTVPTPTPDTQQQASGQEASEPQETVPGDAQTDIESKISVYCQIDPTQLTTLEQIQKQAAALKEKGATTAVITLKNADGNIFYASQNETAKAAVAKTTIDLKMVAETLIESGITPCANLYVFMDKTVPNINRATAVKYQDTDFNWLDSAKELGGKPWANPASSAMHEYIYSITDEILSAGFKEIIYSGVQMPTGYSLDKCNYGVPQDQVLAYMKEFINNAQTKVSSFGGYASFAFDMSAVTGTEYTKYIVSPTRLGAENLVLVTTGEQAQTADIASLTSKLNSNSDISRVILWQTDGNSDNINAGFKGYFIQ